MNEQKLQQFEMLTLYWELKIIEWEVKKSLHEIVTDAEESCNVE